MNKLLSCTLFLFDFLGPRFSKILVATGSTNKTELIDLATGSIKSLPDFPYQVYGMSGFLNSDSKPYLCGGYLASAGESEDCFALENGAWTKVGTKDEIKTGKPFI